MTLRHLPLLAVFHFVVQWLLPPTKCTIDTVSFEQLFQWKNQYKRHGPLLQTIQQMQNSSAILHFIELSHNFTDDDLTNCMRVSLASLNYTVNTKAYEQFNGEADTALRTANFLSNLFSSNLQGNSSLQHLLADQDFYWSLLLANLQSNALIFGAGISFANQFLIEHPKVLEKLAKFTPYLHRNESLNNESVRLNLAEKNHLYGGTNGREQFHSEWYWKLAVPHYSAIQAEWQNFPTRSQLHHLQGVWTSPFLDCGLTKTWLVTYIVPFFRINTRDPIHSSTTLVGVVFVSIDLKPIDITQCTEENSFFAGAHKCHAPSTECHSIFGLGFHRGSYYCTCRPGYYYPNASSFLSFSSAFDNSRQPNFFGGKEIENAFVDTIVSPIEEQDRFFPRDFICLPCESGCSDCDDKSPCLEKFNETFREIIYYFQAACVVLTVLIGLTIFKLRYTKRVASSRWVMLETILLGAIFLYLTILLRVSPSSIITCFLEPWFREIGFAFCYGSIVIKVYRIYAEFQTRKAHRVCVRDKDLLKYLLGIVLIVFGYMSAWTALVIDGIDDIRSLNFFGNTFNVSSKNILDEKYTISGLKYFVCRQLAWDYVTEIGELLFLLSGVYLTYRIRNAKREIYKEKITLTLSILLETTVSLITYVIKHAFWSHPQLHPDHILLLYLIRCHSTVTPMIIILFMPKFFYQKPKRPIHQRSRHLSSAEVSDTLPDAINIHSAILANGEIDIGEINLSDMDPEDIRSELRRLYTQLQILKNKSIRKDNPHISKRRGGRKSHRRFSLQHFHHKHKHDQEVTEVSRTPEESTASMDGGTSCVPDGPSMCKTTDLEHGNSSTSNKSCHKHP